MDLALAFVILPLFSSAVGAWIAGSSGISYLVFLPNLAALVVGAVVLFQRQRVVEFSLKRPNFIFWTVFILIGASLFFPGVDSVHRWLPVGPLRLNASMAFVPIILFASVGGHKIWTGVGMCLLALICVLQPDAGQATAFASAGIIIFAFDRSKPIGLRVGGALVLIAFAALAWTKPDPLKPVAHVEQILHLAYSQGPWKIIVALFAIILLISPFIWFLQKSPRPKGRVLSASYLVWFLVSYIVTEYGYFPVPILGAGAGPVLGWIFAITFLAKDL